MVTFKQARLFLRSGRKINTTHSLSLVLIGSSIIISNPNTD